MGALGVTQDVHPVGDHALKEPLELLGRLKSASVNGEEQPEFWPELRVRGPRPGISSHRGQVRLLAERVGRCSQDTLAQSSEDGNEHLLLGSEMMHQRRRRAGQMVAGPRRLSRRVVCAGAVGRGAPLGLTFGVRVGERATDALDAIVLEIAR